MNVIGIDDMKQSTIAQIKTDLHEAIKLGLSMFIWSAPGIGKSEAVQQVALQLGRKLFDVRATLLDPVDLRGLPFVGADGRSAWAAPTFLPTVEDGPSLLFLDELNSAPQATQAACYQLVIPPHKLGEYQLPDSCCVVAAGNREGDRSVTHRMPAALANRFVHAEAKPDVDAFCAHGSASGFATEVLAFIRWRGAGDPVHDKPGLLHDMTPLTGGNSKAFPSPRSWEMVSKIVLGGCCNGAEVDLITGAVGAGAAAEFTAFLKIWRSLPDVASVFADPKGAIVPDIDNPAARYAVCSAIAAKATDVNFGAAVEYVERMGERELGTLLVRDSISRTPMITKTQAFIKWTSENPDLI